MKTASWVIVHKDTREPIAETFLPHVAAAVNREKYEAIPIRIWLAEVNASTLGVTPDASTLGVTPNAE